MIGRRIVAVALVVLGGVLLLFAPGTWAGVVLVVLGLVVEGLGIYVEHRR